MPPFLNQKLSLLDTLRHSFKFWWQTLTAVISLGLLASILGNIAIPIQWLALTTQKNLLIGLSMVGFFVSLIPYCAIFSILDNSAHQQKIKSSQGIAFSLTRFPAYFLVTLLLISVLGLPLSIGIAAFYHEKLLSVLIIMILLMFFLSVYANTIFTLAATENIPVGLAISKGIRLVKNCWLYTFCVLFFIYAFQFLIQRALMVGGPILLIISNALLIPLKISASIVLLYQLKLRH